MPRINPKNLTVDFSMLQKLSMSDRIAMLKSERGRDYLSSLTPVQYAMLFPDYFRRGLPDLGKTATPTKLGFFGQMRRAITGGPSYGGAAPSAPARPGTAAPSAPASTKGSTPAASSGTKFAWEKRLDEILSKSRTEKDGGKGGTASNAPIEDNPLAVDRKNAAQQLSKEDRIHMYALSVAEKGDSSPIRNAMLMESIYNRYFAQKKSSLMATMKDDYYQPLMPDRDPRGWARYQQAKKRLKSDPDYFKKLDDAHNQVINGSNHTKLGTHNASAGVARSARRTQTITAESKEEVYSRKDIIKFADIHGLGTVRNEKSWFESMKKRMDEYYANQANNKDVPRPEDIKKSALEKASTATPGDPSKTGTTQQARVEGPRERVLGKDKPPLVASSLEDPKIFTKDSVNKMISDGRKYFELNYDFPGAQEAARIIEAAGGQVVPYSRGVRNAEWKEPPQSTQKVIDDLVKTGKKLGHLDNTETQNMSYDEFTRIIKETEKSGMTMIPKNPHLNGLNNNWIKFLKDNPDYAKKIPYINVENVGSMDSAQYETLKKIKELVPGAQINGVDWTANRPSQDKIKYFQDNFGVVQIAKGSESKYIFAKGNTQTFNDQTGKIGESIDVTKDYMSIANQRLKNFPEFFKKQLEGLPEDQRNKFLQQIASIPDDKLPEFSEYLQSLPVPEQREIIPQITESAPGEIPNLINGVIETQQKVAGIRRLPLKDELKEYYNYATKKTGIKFEVSSGGQTEEHRVRGSSHRHNVDVEGTYGAGDGRLFIENKDGSKRYLSIYRKEDLPLIQSYVKAFASVAPGAGIGAGYMGKTKKDEGELIHIGGPNYKGGPPKNYRGQRYIGEAFEAGRSLYGTDTTTSEFENFLKSQQRARLEAQRSTEAQPQQTAPNPPPAQQQNPAGTQSQTATVIPPRPPPTSSYRLTGAAAYLPQNTIRQYLPAGAELSRDGSTVTIPSDSLDTYLKDPKIQESLQTSGITPDQLKGYLESVQAAPAAPAEESKKLYAGGTIRGLSTGGTERTESGPDSESVADFGEERGRPVKVTQESTSGIAPTPSGDTQPLIGPDGNPIAMINPKSESVITESATGQTTIVPVQREAHEIIEPKQDKERNDYAEKEAVKQMADLENSIMEKMRKEFQNQEPLPTNNPQLAEMHHSYTENAFSFSNSFIRALGIAYAKNIRGKDPKNLAFGRTDIA